jgi:hypothetical protein
MVDYIYNNLINQCLEEICLNNINPETLVVLRNDITQIKPILIQRFFDVESNYHLDNIRKPPPPATCIKLIDGLDKCSENVVYNTYLCNSHTTQLSKSAELVLSSIYAGFELEEIIDFIENGASQDMLNYLSNAPIYLGTIFNTFHYMFMHLEDQDLILDDNLDDDLDEIEDSFDIPKYEDIEGVKSENQLECFVCRVENTSTNIVLSCNHNFCYDCLTSLKKMTCPFCRNPIDLKSIKRTC